MRVDEKAVEKAKGKILNTIFFDQDCVEDKIKNKKAFACYLEKQLEDKINLYDKLIKPILQEIEDGHFIYGALSFYDHYHGEWLNNYVFELGPKKAEYPKGPKKVMKFYKDYSSCFIPMTDIIVEHRGPRGGSCILCINKLKGDISYKKYDLEHPGFNEKDCTTLASYEEKPGGGSCCTKCDKSKDFCDSLGKYDINLKKENIKNLTGTLSLEKENKKKLCNLFRFFAYLGEAGLEYLYCFIPTSTVPAGIIFLHLKEILSDKCIDFFQTLSNQLFLQLSFGMSLAKAKHDFLEHSVRIAIISILVDSFAHNIAAHSLSALVWLLKQQKQRQKDDASPFHLFKKSLDDLKKDFNGEKTYELIEKIVTTKNLAKQLAPVPGGDSFAQYLANKAAFWSGVTRDFECGGEAMTWYDLLHNFADNPLFLGTIAHSEGINKIEIKVGVGPDSEQKTHNFCTIDLSSAFNMKSANDPNQEFIKPIVFNEDFDDGKIKKTLSDWKLFLPNGIVGQHALYTIFENTIRNIKHATPDELNKAKEHGIEFNVFISKENDNKHFKTAIWLGNKSEIIVKDEQGEVVRDQDGNIIWVDNRICDLLKEQIVNDSGTPRMGGNSQDKICASMLYNNVFSKVDINDEEDPKHPYPWISVNRDPKSEKEELGVIKRSFCIWKGADKVRIISDNGSDEIKNQSPDKKNEDKEDTITIKVSELTHENPSRFKFVIVPKSEENSESESGEDKQGSKGDLAKRGIVRIMDELECSGDDLDSFYKAWNNKWIKFNGTVVLGFGNLVTFVVCHHGGKWICNRLSPLQKFDNIDKSTFCYDGKDFSTCKDDFCTISFKHRGELDLGDLKFANHLDFIRKFRHKDGFYIKDEMKCEFIETLLTDIEIYDNRIFERAKSQEKIDIFDDKLFLHIFDENTGKDDFKNRVKMNKVNFFIIHLSYIESLNFSEKAISAFIEACGMKLDHQTKLVITTGRGRGEWHNNLDKKHKPHVLFKPIDSLLKAVEDGLTLNDDFQVKYNIVKVIFGS